MAPVLRDGVTSYKFRVLRATAEDIPLLTYIPQPVLRLSHIIRLVHLAEVTFPTEAKHDIRGKPVHRDAPGSES